MTRSFNLGVLNLMRKRLLQTITLSSSPSPHTIIPFSSSTLKLPLSYNYFSLHSRNYHIQNIPQPFISRSRSVTRPNLKPDFSNLVVVEGIYSYDKALKTVQDERISAVFFYTEPGCWRSIKRIAPIFHQLLCEQFRHIRIYMVYVRQHAIGLSLHKLGVKSPTFHFYLNGEKVDELVSASVPRLKEILANVYNPSGMKKKRTRAKKDKKDKNDGVDLSQLVEVLPSSFPVSSHPKVMEDVESLHGADVKSNTWWFAKGLFLSREKR